MIHNVIDIPTKGFLEGVFVDDGFNRIRHGQGEQCGLEEQIKRHFGQYRGNIGTGTKIQGIQMIVDILLTHALIQGTI